MWTLQKWTRSMHIAFSQILAYRLNFFLMVVGPSLVFFFVKFSVWKSIYTSSGKELIGGQNLEEMLQYHLWVLIVGLLAQSHNSMKLAEDIRLGRISSYLIYPVELWEFHTAQYFSFQIIQWITSGFTLLVFSSFLGTFTFEQFFSGFAYTSLVGLFWFALQFCFGLLSFWLEQTWVLRVIFQILAQLFSGAIIPINLFPEYAQKILPYTPFPYLTYYPVKIFMGSISFSDGRPEVVFLWLLLLLPLNWFIWRRGLKMYTAAGM